MSLIVLILLLTVSELGYHYLQTRKRNKTLAISQVILDTMTKSLYSHILFELGKDKGELVVKRAMNTTRKALKEGYGIVLSDLKITQIKEEK